MEPYIKICGNVLKLVDQYYESMIRYIKHQKVYSSVDIYTYTNIIIPLKIEYMDMYIEHYNGDYTECLKQYSLIDLYFIMHECLTIVVPSIYWKKQYIAIKQMKRKTI